MAEILRKDPATGPSEDIGDVLTSIRRLIAQDSPPDSGESATERLRQFAISQAKMRTVAAPSAPPQSPSHPLILTENKRVAEAPARLITDLLDSPDPDSVAAREDLAQHQQPEDDMMTFQDSQQPESTPRPTTVPLHLTPQPQISAVAADVPVPHTPAGDPAPMQDELNIFTAQQADLPADPPFYGLIRNAVIREMEGELGSRMTRNLRQLIRAEIAQALQEATRAQ